MSSAVRLSRAEMRRGVVLTGVRAAAVDSIAAPFAFAAAAGGVVIAISEYDPDGTVGVRIPSRRTAIDWSKM